MPQLPPPPLLVIAGPVPDNAAVRALCARLRTVISTSATDTVIVDVGALPATCRSIEALARLQLTARRSQRHIRLRRTSPALQDLLDLAGLADVVPNDA